MRTKLHIIKTLAIAFSFVTTGVSSLWAETVVDVQQPGTLSSLLTSMEKDVRLTGSINGSDIKYLREQIADGNISSLNLSDASIVGGGDAYDGTNRTANDTIGTGMFSEFSSLKYVDLPKSVVYIASNSFSQSGLKKVVIPDNVKEVGMDAFAYCYSLDTVVVGRKVKNLGQGVFYGSSVKVAYVMPMAIPQITYYLFSSDPEIMVYSEMEKDYGESDWSQFGTVKGGLEEYYTQVQDPATILRAKFGVYFKDDACTVLKDDYKAMSDSDLSAAMRNDEISDDLIAIAVKVKNDDWAKYEKDFRIHEYSAYSDANYWNTLLMSTGGSYMGNPTGIYSTDNAPIYVFVDQDIPSDASLYFAGCVGNNLISNAKSGTRLSRGLNIVDGEKNALYYIVYTADTRSMTKKLSEWPAIKIHVEGGVVNGYYDLSRHNDAEYVELLANATYELFTVRGAETLLNFRTSSYKKAFPSTIDKNLIWFDSLTVWEKELMGICESVVSGRRANPPYNLTGGESYFPIYYNNPNFAIEGDSTDDGYANSTPYRTSYNSFGCISKSFDVSRKDHDDWCAGHECGHNNQQTINLEGCTEVSNNLFSNVICFLDGRTTSKGLSLSTTMNDYVHHTPYFVRNVSSMMRMYYQLYLYYHQAQKNTSFYPTLFQKLREDPLALWDNTDNSSLKFVRKVCEVAQEDLTDFFTAWGFFEPCQLVIDDYGVRNLTVSQEDIDRTLAEISQYTKKNREILFVEDRADYVLTTDFITTGGEKRLECETVGLYANLGQFSDFLSASTEPSEYTYMQADSFYAMTGKGGIGFLVLNTEGKMLYASNTLGFCIPSCIGNDFTIYSVDVDGTLHEVRKQEGGLEIVHMTEPGNLSDSLTTQAVKAIITGPLNGTDIKYLRRLTNEEKLQSIDLSGATIVGGGDAYYENNTTYPDAIGGDFFYNCAKLGSVILPQSVNTIGHQAFSHTGLQNVEIPEGVTSIGFDAFAYCAQLSKVIIGPDVEDIQQGAFYESTVKDVYVKPTTPPSIAGYLFSSKPTIHVYASALADYEASGWAEFGTLVGDLEECDLTEVKDIEVISQTTPKDGYIYDLFGRRVYSLQPANIYIKDGKKIIFLR